MDLTTSDPRSYPADETHPRLRNPDPDAIRQQRLDDAWQFPDRDREDGHEPPPLRSVCIDRTGARFSEE